MFNDDLMQFIVSLVAKIIQKSFEELYTVSVVRKNIIALAPNSSTDRISGLHSIHFIAQERSMEAIIKPVGKSDCTITRLKLLSQLRYPVMGSYLRRCVRRLLLQAPNCYSKVYHTYTEFLRNTFLKKKNVRSSPSSLG